LLSLLLRTTPRSTLFPYTTLFRSRRGMVLVSEDRRRYGLILDKTIAFNLSLSSLAKLTKNRLIDQGLEFQKNNHFFQSLRVKAPDRKSTRLNSSHVSISYAVFCLK